MTSAPVKFPPYAKLAQIVLGVIGLFFVLYIGQDIIVPFVFAFIIAILLNPVVNYLSKKINRIVSIVIAIFLTVVFVGALGYFIVSQIALFTEALPQFKQKFELMINDILKWVSETFNVSQAKIDAWITKTRKEGVDGVTIVTEALNTLMGLLVIFVMPVFVFIILYYKPLLLEFIGQLFKRGEQEIVGEVLTETKSLIQNYLVGLSIEAVIVAILNSVGLLILGMPYAILLGIIGALLNVIPYIGIVIASAISMLVAIGAKSASTAFWVFIVYLIVQFIDNQYIVPRIVASKVKINALVSIVVVLVGGAIWGISGMFLAIPLTAILKVIFDRVNGLKPFGYLLGDTQPGDDKIIFRKKTPK